MVNKRLVAAGAVGAGAAVAAAFAARRAGQSGALEEVATFDHQVTGVAATADGRLFVNFPRWTDDAPVSVAEVLQDGSLRPYPDEAWNAWRNAKASEMPVGEHFVCVQSIVPDGQGNLWVLDPGAPGNERILEGAPKLVRIDLATNAATKVIPVKEDVALQGSYLNDIRFSSDGRWGYVTDSGTRGAIIVIDLESGEGFRALDGHPSTQVDKSVKVIVDGKPLVRPDGRQPMFASDGIAISGDGRTLYWQALTGKTLYSIDTDLLRPEVSDVDRGAGVQTVATTHVADGLWDEQGGGPLSHRAGRERDHQARGRPDRDGADRPAAPLAGHLQRGAGRDDLRHRQPHPGHRLVQAGRPAVDQDGALCLPARGLSGHPT